MKDNLEQKFKELENQFDIEEPTIGHFNRFEAKLARATEEKQTIKWNHKTWKWLSVAAAIVLTFGLWFTTTSISSEGMQLAEVSPEMEETQSFFITTINKELAEIKKQKNTENAAIIDNAFQHLNELETAYKKLTIDLKETADDKRIIYAMIYNFQQRIEILKTLLEQLEDIKELKNEVKQA